MCGFFVCLQFRESKLSFEEICVSLGEKMELKKIGTDPSVSPT